jgi:predicted nucleotidyltransferase
MLQTLSEKNFFMKVEGVKVDEALFEVLASFSDAAISVNAPWLIIGATARILLLERIYGWPSGLGTQDIDFAVQIGDWEHYRQLCESIMKNDVFEAERKPAKRFRSKENMVFDLVPYGGVENERKQVFWPSHNDDVMTVRGFDSAAKDAIKVLVNQKLTVSVVSPRGLCALKFFAWEERHAQHAGRDAKDIAYLYKNIELLYPPEILFGDYPDAIEFADYQIQSAGHYQLGCDVGELLVEDDRGFLVDLISGELEENEDSLLCRELHRYTAMQSIEETCQALNFFYKGLCTK